MKTQFVIWLCSVFLDALCYATSSSLVSELRTWNETRYIRCIYCMNYDRVHISLFGCKPKRPIMCTGNACFMRFHKKYVRPQVMYTSGCLNLTNDEVKTISDVQKRSKETGNPNGTLLCELANLTDTCICSNINNCNFIDLQPDFSEYSNAKIFDNVTIEDDDHLRNFLPQEYRKLQLKTRSSESSKLNIYNFFTFFVCFYFWYRWF